MSKSTVLYKALPELAGINPERIRMVVVFSPLHFCQLIQKFRLEQAEN